MMRLWESIFCHGTKYIPKVDIGSKSQRDEDGEKRWKYSSDEVYEVSWQDVWSQ